MFLKRQYKINQTFKSLLTQTTSKIGVVFLFHKLNNSPPAKGEQTLVRCSLRNEGEGGRSDRGGFIHTQKSSYLFILTSNRGGFLLLYIRNLAIIY